MVVDQPSPSGGSGGGAGATGASAGTTTGGETTGGETTGGETTGGTSGVGGSATTGGTGGSVTVTTTGAGPAGCGQSCAGMDFFCTCTSTCEGLNLEADCKTDPNGQATCNCLINGQFVGSCGGPSQGIACDLFGGCCAEFFPDQGG